MIFKIALGHAIRETRTSKGLTLREVAANGFVSIGHLCDIERGVKDASSVVIEAIAKGLEVDPCDLVIEAGYLMAEDQVAVPETPESLFGELFVPVHSSPVG